MRRLFDADALRPRSSLRFELGEASQRGHSALGAGPAEGFALRTANAELRAYVNVCPHRASPVDLGDGKLFHSNGTLECQSHGAYFDPSTGVCVDGPCVGKALQPLPIEERDGAVWLLEQAGDVREDTDDDR